MGKSNFEYFSEKLEKLNNRVNEVEEQAYTLRKEMQGIDQQDSEKMSLLEKRISEIKRKKETVLGELKQLENEIEIRYE